MTMAPAAQRITFLGLGKMASYMLRPLLAAGAVDPSKVVVTRATQQTLDEASTMFPDVNATLDNAEAVANADVVFVGIKPQDFKSVAEMVHGKIAPHASVVSLMGSITIKQIQTGFKHEPVMRTMPNVPTALGLGVLPYYPSAEMAEHQVANVRALFAVMGTDFALPKEAQMDMVTAVSGSCPAYFLLVLESLVEAGVHIGLKRDMAWQLVVKSMLGTSSMALQHNGNLAELKYDVTSPGGIAAAALYQAEKSALRSTVSDMVWGAYRRALELADDHDDNIVFGPGYWQPRRVNDRIVALPPRELKHASKPTG
eukprot:m.184657 g.184657  ORF g.184657 m.184657 type:complete len:313 (+) comp18102_c1_seq1:54-992(+)